MEVRPLEQLLCDAGHLDTDQFRLAREELVRLGSGGSGSIPSGSIYEAAIQLGFIAEDAWVRAVCRLTHTPAIDLTAKTVEAEVLALVSVSIIDKHRCLPLFVGAPAGSESSQRSILYLGLEDPHQSEIVAEVARGTGFEVRPVVVGPLQLTLALERFYPPSTRRRVSSADALVASDTSPLVEGPSSEIAGAVVVEPERMEPPVREAEGEESHEIPTRVILNALTKLLVGSGAIDRNDLLAEVAELRARERLQPDD